MEADLTDTSYAASNVLASVDDPNGSPLTFDPSATGIGQAFPFNSSQQDLFLDCAGWNDTTTEVQLRRSLLHPRLRRVSSAVIQRPG